MNSQFFVGVIVDRQDPEQMGRVRVRALGFHEQNKSLVPTESLPWATVMLPSTGPSVSGLGDNPFLVEGSWVVGFFRDKFLQDPIIIGSLPGKPNQKLSGTLGFSDPNEKYPIYTNESDINKLARGENTVSNSIDSAIGEPNSPYAAVYPYNHVHESESGHIFEVDDTEGAERLHRRHTSGTFEQIHPDGTMVTKVVNENYTIVASNDKIHVIANQTKKVDGNVSETTSGNNTESISGNSTITIGGNNDISVTGNFNLKVDGNVVIDCSHIELGKGSTEKLVLGNKFMEFFNQHRHQTGVGNTSIVIEPFTEELLSQQDNTTL